MPLLEEGWFEGPKGAEGLLTPPWPLLRALREASVPATALLAFASEGDNIPDAVALADAAGDVVGGETAAARGGWRLPGSWAHLYGPRNPFF